MTPEQKKQFTDGIIAMCDIKNDISFCPSDFLMTDTMDGCVIDGKTQCEKCARQACEKFFEENGL